MSSVAYLEQNAMHCALNEIRIPVGCARAMSNGHRRCNRNEDILGYVNVESNAYNGHPFLIRLPYSITQAMPSIPFGILMEFW